MSQDFNAKLVEAVEKYPCLYNFSLNDYSNKNVTEKAWIEVANETDSNVSKCKESCRNIRTVFTRHLKPPPSGSKPKKPYYLNNMLHFLIPFLKPCLSEVTGSLLPTSDEVENIEVVNYVDEDEMDLNPELLNTNLPYENTKKRKQNVSDVDKCFMEFCKQNSSNETPRKQFLLSVLPEVERKQYRSFRYKFLELIDSTVDSNN